MLGYGGLNRAEGRVTRISHERESLHAAHARGEVPDRHLDGQFTAMTDELAAVAASPAHPSLTQARDMADDLHHRISLESVHRAVPPVVLPGVAADCGPHPLRQLPELWRRHRRDPLRRPAHPDAVGHPGPDGVPLDGEGGRLPDLFRILWEDAPLAAAADPGTPLAEVDHLTDEAAEVLRRYGAGTAQVAAVRARVLLATGRVEQARELLDLVGDGGGEAGPPATAVTRCTVALLRGDLDTLLRVLNHGEATGARGREWTLLTAASLIPLAHVVDAATTVERLAGVVAAASGVPDLAPAMLHVISYLARAGQPETALSLLVRTVDTADLPVEAVPALQAVVEEGWSSDPASDLGARRLVTGGPTIRELAEQLTAPWQAAADALDLRNGRSMWTTLVPATRDYPVPPVEVADLAGIPGLRNLALPAALPAGLCGEELPGVGPVDVASLDAAEALCATVMYSLLGLQDAADAVVDRMRCFTAADGDARVLDVAAEFVRRADCAVGHGAGCFACARRVAPQSTGLLAEVDRAIRESVCAGTAHDAPSRVHAQISRWADAHPLVRRLISLDLLLAGCLPTRPAVELAVQGLWSAVRLLPRAVPLTGGALISTVHGAVAVDGTGEPVGRGIVDATVVGAVTTIARRLPTPPPGSRTGLVDHVADLADLAESLVGAGARYEAVTVCDAGLDAVGANWTGTGVACGLIRGEVGADDDGPVRLLRARSAALAGVGNAAASSRLAHQAAGAAEYRGRWRLAEDCRLEAAARRG